MDEHGSALRCGAVRYKVLTWIGRMNRMMLYGAVRYKVLTWIGRMNRMMLYRKFYHEVHEGHEEIDYRWSIQ